MNRLLLGLSVLFWTSAPLFPQHSQAQLTIVKLDAPIYPPIATAARVWGEVHLQVKISLDGSAASVTLQSGPPMLRQAAEDSATGSRFKASLDNELGTYPLIYQFELDVMKCDEERDPSYPRVKYEGNIVSIAEQAVPICDPGATIQKVRSAKCLYLWKCGSKAK